MHQTATLTLMVLAAPRCLLLLSLLVLTVTSDQ